jgi:hydrogenase nickel incorporation protein HypB
MFRRADLVLITKTDLLPYLDISLDAIRDALAHVMPTPLAFAVSARTGDGLDQWFNWLADRAGEVVRPRRDSGDPQHHHQKA